MPLGGAQVGTPAPLDGGRKVKTGMSEPFSFRSRFWNVEAQTPTSRLSTVESTCW
ncbi:hypothetical protein D3C85_1841650 [compost metagenome]